MMKHTVLVVGSINQDVVVHTPSFVKAGETLAITKKEVFPGGKGANQAVSLARNGETVFFLGAVGKDDAGTTLIHVLKENAVETKYIQVFDHVSTGQAFIQLVKGQNAILIEHGANYALDKQTIQTNEELFSKVEACVAQCEVQDEVLLQTALFCEKYQIPFFLNPAPARELSKEILQRVFLLTPNESELERLTGLSVNSDQECFDATASLEKSCGCKVVVTCGKRGCFSIEGGKPNFVPATQVDAVDTTAAGDSFQGALVSEYLRTKDLNAAMEYANRFAALSVTRKGAIPSIPTRKEVEEITK